ncbi:ImmA/IrrE family metallo-endopeptidase [Streptomyces ossamyceticus]
MQQRAGRRVQDPISMCLIGRPYKAALQGGPGRADPASRRPCRTPPRPWLTAALLVAVATDANDRPRDERSARRLRKAAAAGESGLTSAFRICIAHGFGHLLLYPGREVVLDRPVRVNLRDKTSSTASDREEIEANAFAASLLMSADLVRSELQPLPAVVRRDPDRRAAALVALFEVSGAAMGFRSINLGLVS